jgi:hypothetical protein
MFPFYKGWIEIDAPTEGMAREAFRACYPDRHEGTLNCSFVYTQDEFEKTDMFKNVYPDEYCHQKIVVHILKSLGRYK